MTTGKKKILFIDHDPKITGSTVSMRYLVDGFYKKGYDIMLLTPKSEQTLKYFWNYNISTIFWKYNVELALYSTNTTRINSFSGIKNVLRLLINLVNGLFLSYIYLRRIKPDLIYINEYVLSQFAITAKLLKIPVVTHVRSPFLKGSFGIRRYILSNILKMFNNYVFAISDQEAGQILENIHNNKNNIKVIREFLDENDFFADYDINNLKKSFSIPSDKKILLMLGGIEPIKGSFEIIEAFSKLIIKHQDVFLIIAGPINNNPYYNKNCFDFIDLNRLNENVSIVNYTENKHQLIACSDILISSSTVSHFSRPVIEAWAQKKAIVASNTIHSVEFIEDNVNGLLYEIGNSESLSAKLSHLLADSHKLVSLGEAGYTKARKEYSAEINVNKIVNYCISLL